VEEVEGEGVGEVEGGERGRRRGEEGEGSVMGRGRGGGGDKHICRAPSSSGNTVSYIHDHKQLGVKVKIGLIFMQDLPKRGLK